jgi:hypothetical protein
MKDQQSPERETAYPAIDSVKKDILDARRNANRWLSIYNLYSRGGFGLNKNTENKYFNRFVSEVIKLYMQLRMKCFDRKSGQIYKYYIPLLKIDKYLLGEEEIKREEWIKNFIKLNRLIEEVGISKIEMPSVKFEGVEE